MPTKVRQDSSTNLSARVATYAASSSVSPWSVILTAKTAGTSTGPLLLVPTETRTVAAWPSFEIDGGLDAHGGVAPVINRHAASLFAAVIHFPLDRAFTFVLQEKLQRRLRQAAIQRRNQEGFYALDGAPFRLVGRLILCARAEGKEPGRDDENGLPHASIRHYLYLVSGSGGK
jgi:hypothetical protein